MAEEKTMEQHQLERLAKEPPAQKPKKHATKGLRKGNYVMVIIGPAVNKKGWITNSKKIKGQTMYLVENTGKSNQDEALLGRFKSDELKRIKP